MSATATARVVTDTFEVICPLCGRLTERTTSQREALDARDFHSFETGHASDVLVQFDGRTIIRLVAMVAEVSIDLDVP